MSGVLSGGLGGRGRGGGWGCGGGPPLLAAAVFLDDECRGIAEGCLVDGQREFIVRVDVDDQVDGREFVADEAEGLADEAFAADADVGLAEFAAHREAEPGGGGVGAAALAGGGGTARGRFGPGHAHDAQGAAHEGELGIEDGLVLPGVGEAAGFGEGGGHERVRRSGEADFGSEGSVGVLPSAMMSATTRDVVRVAAVAVLAAAGMTLGGCNRRTIEITSEPAGALVYLNDIEVGRTPLEVDFRYYGVYDVRLALAGYRPLATSAEAVAPFSEYPGPDLVTSATKTHVVVTWNFVLEQLPTDRAQLERELIDRAKATRAEAPEVEAAAAAGTESAAPGTSPVAKPSTPATPSTPAVPSAPAPPSTLAAPSAPSAPSPPAKPGT